MINKIYTEDCIETMARMPDNYLHCVVTSPPYWGLRKYGEYEQPWPAVSYVPLPGLPEIHVQEMTCQLGLEPTPEAYVGHIVYIFWEIKRVLRQDGNCWLNLGDSYAGGNYRGGGVETANGKQVSSKGTIDFMARTAPSIPPGLKPKDLTGIPWRVAFALQADGWYLRSDIIWAKGISGQAVKAGWSGNPMPESVTDRPTKAHEYLFLLTKNDRYYYDAEAIKEKAKDWGVRDRKEGSAFVNGTPGRSRQNGGTDCNFSETGRNRRTVWTIATKPYPGSHFAVFPDDLVKPCVLAGSPQKVCSKCGKGWERILEKTPMEIRRSERGAAMGEYGRTQSSGTMVAPAESKTVGWRPACSCSAPPAKSIVYDPFGGSGTTAGVAHQYGRNWIISEISPEYVKDCAAPRLEKTRQQTIF